MADLTDYERRAREHMPTDPDALRAEIHRLKAEGLTVRDIASALRLSIANVLNLIAGQDP